MTKANWAVAASTMLLVAGTAGAAMDPSQKCLSGRAKATGTYQQCVQKWLAGCYGGTSCTDSKLSKCRETYRKAWDKLVTLNTAPWAGNGATFTAFLGGLNGGGGFAGANDWRLPAFAELMTVLNQPYPCATAPCVDSAFGSFTQSDYYWSSTTSAYSPCYAWDVYFFDGSVGVDFKDALISVRAVRGGL